MYLKTWISLTDLQPKTKNMFQPRFRARLFLSLAKCEKMCYTYNAEDVRIRNLCADEDTVYTYNTNCKLSKLLCKTTNGVVTKYVYGRGLIGEEVNNSFKTYHFDFRGSTVAVTDASGNITDTFEYDTYGKQISHTGDSNIIFGYNGRDGVVTDNNGLIYMRERYYSPEIRRFINADIIPGEITNAITLNRYAYANGNPVSNIDPFGLSVLDWIKDKCNEAKDSVVDTATEIGNTVKDVFNKVVNQFKKSTAEGDLDWFLDLTLGAEKDEHGIYHIDQNYWQSIHFVGYNDLYDKAFDFGVGMTGYTVSKDKFQFTTEDGTDYVIWMWKGDYINLGSGAEVGIYKESVIPGQWLTSKENAMPMSLKLTEIDTGNVLFDYHPSEKQWWINGFDPSHQNAYAKNLQLTVTIDFSSNLDIYKAFKKAWDGRGWKFDDMQATYNWRDK